MRKIEKDTCVPFVDGKPARRGASESTGDAYYLHGNLIAAHRTVGEAHGIVLSHAGWNSATTRSRLNAILDAMGVATVRASIEGGLLGLDIVDRVNGERYVTRVEFADLPDSTRQGYWIPMSHERGFASMFSFGAAAPLRDAG